MGPSCQFFIGKGGVGKSTVSALTAIYLSLHERNTLLVSMDPAHNQRDIFEQEFSERPKQVTPTLRVKETDADFWIEKYLSETQRHIKQVYRYESAFNLQEYFNVLQFSPGLEEYALLLAFEDIIHKFHHQDVIVFDMAPTALTLRFFSLPFITLIWLRALLQLRTQIYKKKEIISKIRIGTKEIEQDKVKSKLEKLIQNYEHLSQHFLSSMTRINLVMNNDRLSLAEAKRIRDKLAEIGITIDEVVINKLGPDEDSGHIEEEFTQQKISRFPLANEALAGFRTLTDYIRLNESAFRQ